MFFSINDIYQVSSNERPRRRHQTLSIYIQYPCLFIGNKHTNLIFTHLRALFNLHVHAFFCSLSAAPHPPRTHPPTIANERNTKLWKVNLQLKSSSIVVWPYRFIDIFSVRCIDIRLVPFSQPLCCSMPDVLSALLSNNSWPIHFRLLYFVLGFRCLWNKYIHSTHTPCIAWETIVNYFCSCHRYYYYRQTFVIQWEKKEREELRARVSARFLKQFCLHTSIAM